MLLPSIIQEQGDVDLFSARLFRKPSSCSDSEEELDDSLMDGSSSDGDDLLSG
jgi:hypothetical protein